MSDTQEKTDQPSQAETKPDEKKAPPEKKDATEEKPEAAGGGEPTGADTEKEPAAEPPASELETLLDTYPLREPSEDPRWALRTVWIWIGFTLLSLAFILTLLILGAIHD